MNFHRLAAHQNGVDICAFLDQQKKTVDSYLDDFIPRGDAYPEIIHEAMRYSVFAGGKRIRPILALATGEALKGDFHRLIYLACSLEMIHTYSLIHDDLPAMDDDDLRRGQPTNHKKFGEGIAILAGNGLLTLAFQLLGQIPGGAEVAELKVQVIHRICRAIGTIRGMLAGQVLDLISQGKPISVDQLQYIHTSKTGALIQASIACAAILCDADEEARQRLNNYGSGIGLAFQIVDDILDIEATSEELGKTPGKDGAEEKATFPAMYGIQKSREISSQLIHDAIQEIGFLGPRGEVLREVARFIDARRS